MMKGAELDYIDNMDNLSEIVDETLAFLQMVFVVVILALLLITVVVVTFVEMTKWININSLQFSTKANYLVSWGRSPCIHGSYLSFLHSHRLAKVQI